MAPHKKAGLSAKNPSPLLQKEHRSPRTVLVTWLWSIANLLIDPFSVVRSADLHNELKPWTILRFEVFNRDRWHINKPSTNFQLFLR